MNECAFKGEIRRDNLYTMNTGEYSVRGVVRGGSRGSIDPPRILEDTLKELNIWPFAGVNISLHFLARARE